MAWGGRRWLLRNARSGCLSWRITLILPLFTDKKSEILCCSLVKTHFSIFLIVFSVPYSGARSHLSPALPSCQRLAWSKVPANTGAQVSPESLATGPPVLRSTPCPLAVPHSRGLSLNTSNKGVFRAGVWVFLFVCVGFLQARAKDMSCSYQPVSLPGWGHARRAGSRGRAGPAELPAGAGCTWHSASSWRAGSSHSLHSAAWWHQPAKHQPQDTGA